MNNAVFLDRDGTINVEKNYLYRVEDFVFLPKAINALRLLQEANFKLIIVTNQSGIGRGFYTEEDFRILNKWMLEELSKQGICIDAVYYCPHLPDARIEAYRKICNCRKPALGLYKQAIKDFDIDMTHSYSIGDKIRDCSICENMMCKGYLIGTNEKPEIIQKAKNGAFKHVKYAKDLWSAAMNMLEEN